MEAQNSFKFLSRILITFGVLFINAVIFTFLAELICKVIFNIRVSKYLIASDFGNPSDIQKNAVRLFQAIFSFGCFAFSAIVLALAFKQNPLEYLGLNTFPKPLVLFIVPVLCIVTIPLVFWLGDINKAIKLPEFLSSFELELKAKEEQNNKLYELLLGMNSYKEYIFNLIVMALIPSIGEELICRGVLLNILYDYSGKFFRSVVIVALIFTMFHMQFYKSLPMIGLAILLGLIIHWTNGLWASILYHFLNNALLITGSFLEQQGITNLLDEETFQIPIAITISSFIITIAIIVIMNRISSQKLKTHL